MVTQDRSLGVDTGTRFRMHRVDRRGCYKNGRGDLKDGCGCYKNGHGHLMDGCGRFMDGCGHLMDGCGHLMDGCGCYKNGRGHLMDGCGCFMNGCGHHFMSVAIQHIRTYTCVRAYSPVCCSVLRGRPPKWAWSVFSKGWNN